ncbi:gtpase ypt3 [Stylonychia lemnae]|uniref:Gtpase ypt3 n=1 Tax=Stylonychia lemnae TaxID=5949 RepID=A0A078AUG4_STYLE|nr:gtpase ypt3 [Stylonychia lemnae]|eukprot:CDW84508.1 gtpase ypt3 [Stylonychia lemnae]
MQEDEYDYLFKLVMIGDSRVGKTNLLMRYTKDEFDNNTVTTVGVQFARKMIQLENKQIVKAQIWDTAGQERYRSISNVYYRGASGALLVYDITDRKSFQNTSLWLKELRQHADNNLVVLLVGNKVDLVEKREVTKEEAAQFAEDQHLAFVETSALDGNNVDLAYERVIKEIQKVVLAQEQQESQEIEMNKHQQQSNQYQDQGIRKSYINTKKKEVNDMKLSVIGEDTYNQKKKKKNSKCCD